MKTLLAVLIVTGCALSSSPRVIILPPWAFGRTDCIDGTPISVIRGDLLPGDSVEVDAHEARHRDQMAGQCRSFLARFSEDEVFRIRMELDAYCAGIRTRPEHERQMRRDNLRAMAGERSTLDDIVIDRLYREVCP